MKKNNILLIEDNELISIAYKDGLKRAGYLVEHLYNGEKAVDKIHAQKPNIVLMDIIMPKVNGLEVLDELKKRKIKIPVLILSNLDDGYYKEQAFEKGAKNYLVKADNSIEEIIKNIELIIIKL